jgi:peptidoglycan/xylan/chitin deacetylase (PgdA/CDA1 family)
MIKVIPPFDILGPEQITEFLLENNLEMNFTPKQKVYYSFFRPVIPKKIRRMIQEYYCKNINFKDNFIDDSLVKYLESAVNDYDNLFTNLYLNNAACVVVLTHDVEEDKGFHYIPKVIELEEKYGFKSSWNIVPHKYKIDPGIIKLIKETGHEIGIHGYNHDGKLYYSKKIFDERTKDINRALEQYGSVGFRSPMVHRNLEWLEGLNIKYDLSCFDYDPFQPFPGGTGSIWPFIAGKFVEIPYTLPQDHTLYYLLKQDDITIWKNKADWIIKNHGVILTLSHPDYLMESRLMLMYEKLLDYLKQIQNSWKCLPQEIAEWWLKKYLTVKQ